MRVWKVLKNIWAQLHRFVFWAIVLALFWCWIYTFVGDPPREKKVMVYVDAYGLDRRALALRLEEEHMPQGLKMIQVRSFDYDIFGDSLNGDVYIMKESILRATMEESPEKLAPIALPQGRAGWTWEGETYGIRVFDAATQQAPATQYVAYTPYQKREPEDYYLCFDAASPHLASEPRALDNAAWEVAMTFLELP